MRNEPEGMLVILTGFTAGGKTTLKEAAIDWGFYSIVTYTTRDLRLNETNGVDYIKVSKEAFDQMDCNGELCAKNRYVDNSYGTCRGDVGMAANIDAVWSLDVGAAADAEDIIRRALPGIADKIIPRMCVIMVGPIDRDELERRYLERERPNGKPEEQIKADFQARYERDRANYGKLEAQMRENPRMFRRLSPGTREEEKEGLRRLIDGKREIARW